MSLNETNASKLEFQHVHNVCVCVYIDIQLTLSTDNAFVLNYYIFHQ